MREKRGQAAAGAAILLAIIAAALILFVILIPPQERAELLGPDGTSSGSRAGSSGTTASGIVLLTASPGKIDYFAENKIEHPLPSVNVYTQTESKVLAEKNTAYAKRGAFSEKNSIFPFVLPSVELTENVLLSFTVVGSEGSIIITLNGEELFTGEVEKGTIPPLRVPKNLLREENEMVFAVSSPGVAFWATNEVSLKDIRIVGDVTQIEAQSSKQVFLISETEKRNMESVKLKFQPNCNGNEVGVLRITLNGNEIYSGVPDCGVALVPIEFSPSVVNAGENEIIFTAERGTYVLAYVLVESKLKEIDFPAYYFELSSEQYDQVKAAERRVRLQISFVDVVSSKFGDIVFNGHEKHFDTRETTYVADLSEDIVRGVNALKIKPKKTLEIREVRVELVR